VAERVLLIGCGEIGSRHLQAIASVDRVSEIEVVDPRPEQLALGQKRLAEIGAAGSQARLRWLTSLDAASPGGDLCVVATQAAGRRQVVEEAVERLGYRAFLLEKIVTQSVEDYEQLLKFCDSHGVRAWVNCKTRAYPFHQAARRNFDPAAQIQFNVMAGNHGLAVNGIHSVDLFVYYDRSRSLTDTGAVIEPILHHSKRGADIFDLSGTIYAISDKGSVLSITFSGNHLAPPCYVVSSDGYRFVLDQWSRWAWEADAGSGWQWRPTAFEGDLTISTMSRTFVADILARSETELPTLQGCYPAHAYLLSTLQPHFSRLLRRELDRCPVT
jgi:hypothetical protein